jgi:hypothetical protein
VGFDVTDELQIRFSAFISSWRKKWEYNETTVHKLLIDFRKANVSSRKEVLYSIVIEFGVLIKMCLNEMK